MRDLSAELAGYWKTSLVEPEPWLPDRSHLPQLTEDQLRDAACTFKTTTSVALDGFHPRHFALMSSLALRAWAIVMLMVEALGLLPRQVAQLTAALISKGLDKAGFRPIFLFAGFYRVCVRARQTCATDWLQLHDKPYFACGSGRSALDAVWKQAVSAEAAVASKNVAAAPLFDGRRFYENFGLDRMRARALESNFSKVALKVCYNAYRGPRLMKLGDRAVVLGHGEFGLPAGCGFSHVFVCIYSAPAVEAVHAHNPRVKIDL